MIVDVIVDFVGLPYNPTKLLAILQFPIPSCSKHRRGYTTYTCQTMEKVVLIALFHSHTHKHILTLSLSLFSLSLSLFWVPISGLILTFLLLHKLQMKIKLSEYAITINKTS